MIAPLPDWLDLEWKRLTQTRRQGRLPHALLVVGQAGIGKRLLAGHLAALLLCEHADDADQPCGQCSACGWLQAGTHPDLLQLEPGETGKAIKVDQVRRLSTELGMTSHAGRYKVAIIDPADAMNVNAANSLLKTLEEPTPNTLLILVSAAPGRLPRTIVSRCQQIKIAAPSLQAATPWLEAQGLGGDQLPSLWGIARGAPLKIGALADGGQLALRDRRLDELLGLFSGRLDPLKIAAEWSGNSEQLALALHWWLAWLEDIIRWQQAGRPPEEPKMVQMLQQIVEQVDCKPLFGLSDKINKALRGLGSGLNQQMQLEDLLIDWASLGGQSGQRTKRAAKSGR